MVLGQSTLSLIFISFIGAILAFLRFNLSKTKKIFMGDAGSLMIGLILVVSGIKLLQESKQTEYVSIIPFFVVAVLIVPVIDALRVFKNRIRSGKSPFRADRTHLHHLLLSTGLNHKASAFTIILMIVMIIIAGIIGNQIMGLSLSIASMLLLFNVITGILSFQKRLNYWKERIREMEYKKGDSIV
jgi:UDP-GlcNAc:undecaprenyl-phosphate GlcNAc-1-phosphate transferase